MQFLLSSVLLSSYCHQRQSYKQPVNTVSMRGLQQNRPEHKDAGSQPTCTEFLCERRTDLVSNGCAGAIAWDEVDGNITSSIMVSGLQAIDTSRPSPADSPTILRYDCQDAAGNTALPRFRNVSVVCPGAETTCVGDDRINSTSNNLYCSSNGYCLGDNALLTGTQQ
jgi:hypothetical protein